MHAHWNDLGKRLSLQFPYTPFEEAAEPFQDFFRVPELVSAHGFSELERPFRLEVESYIHKFCREIQQPKPSPIVGFLMGLRCAAAESLILRLTTADDSAMTTVFLLPPDVSANAALEWLLVPWWNSFGDQYTVEQFIVDRYLEPE
jgi:hypothetical protein